MSKWETVRLGDVATYINGYAFKPSDWSNSGLSIIRIQNLTGNDYETNYYSGEYNKKYEVKNGDVLISWSASLGVYEWKNSTALLNQHIFKAQFDKLAVDKSYFIHTVSYLLNDMLKETHGSTMKHITKPRFDNILFPYPPLEIQKQIAENLDKVTRTIELCNAILKKLDLLVKARFVEMFGDIIHCPKYKMIKLTDISEVGSSKRIYANEYVEAGIPFYRSKEIRELGNGLKPSVELFISKEKYELIKAKYGIPKVGDILIAAIGATIGYTWIVDTEEPFYYKDGNLIILYIRDNINPIYLNHAVRIIINEFKNTSAFGSAQLALTIEKIQKIKISYPNLILQNQFADFVTQTGKTKSKVKQTLEKAETLKKALMQEYFG